MLSTPPAFVLSQDQTLRKNLIFFRYAASRLRAASSTYTSTSAGRRFAVPCLAKKSLRFTKLGLFALCFVAASRRVLSAHECASGASLRCASPSTKIPAFFLPPNRRTVVAEKITLQFAESHDWLFLSLDTILSNRIKKLSIAFTNLGSADKMKSPRFAQMRWFYLGDKPET